jgi:4,5-dihydroxyphthalate decarboxylase
MPSLPDISADGRLRLSLATGAYDHVRDLTTGVVQAAGIQLIPQDLQIEEIFFRLATTIEWDISEFSFGKYVSLRSRDDTRLTAIPVFPSRVFRHGNIYVNRNSSIREAKDLEGKRVGVQEYRQTAALWVRGMLRDDFGVDTDSFQWVEGGTNAPRKPNPRIDIRPDRALSITHLEDGDTLSAALEAGRIDAMLGAQKPMSIDTAEHLVRLFPDYRARERDYYARTGIFPIMHTLVFREAVHAENPWIAASMFRACEEAKARADAEMRFSGALRYMTPWLLDDVEEIDRVFGGDAWPYGLEANRDHLATLLRYLVEDGFLAAAPTLDDLFLPVGC